MGVARKRFKCIIAVKARIHALSHEMSPEQARGKDLTGLCTRAIFYECPYARVFRP